MKGISSIVGGFFLLLVVMAALYSYQKIYYDEIASLEVQEQSMYKMYEKGSQALLVTGGNTVGTIYAFNPDEMPVTIAYEINYSPFTYRKVNATTLYFDQGSAFNAEAVLSALGNVYAPNGISPWLFFAYKGWPPTTTGIFEIQSLNLSLSWYPIPGSSFPFPEGQNGSSVIGYRVIRSFGGMASFCLYGGKGSLWLDGINIIGNGSSSWKGVLKPGSYLLILNWFPVPASATLDLTVKGAYS